MGVFDKVHNWNVDRKRNSTVNSVKKSFPETTKALEEVKRDVIPKLGNYIDQLLSLEGDVLERANAALKLVVGKVTSRIQEFYKKNDPNGLPSIDLPLVGGLEYKDVGTGALLKYVRENSKKSSEISPLKEIFTSLLETLPDHLEVLLGMHSTKIAEADKHYAGLIKAMVMGPDGEKGLKDLILDALVDSAKSADLSHLKDLVTQALNPLHFSFHNIDANKSSEWKKLLTAIVEETGWNGKTVYSKLKDPVIIKSASVATDHEYALEVSAPLMDALVKLITSGEDQLKAKVMFSGSLTRLEYSLKSLVNLQKSLGTKTDHKRDGSREYISNFFVMVPSLVSKLQGVKGKLDVAQINALSKKLEVAVKGFLSYDHSRDKKAAAATDIDGALSELGRVTSSGFLMDPIKPILQSYGGSLTDSYVSRLASDLKEVYDDLNSIIESADGMEISSSKILGNSSSNSYVASAARDGDVLGNLQSFVAGNSGGAISSKKDAASILAKNKNFPEIGKLCTEISQIHKEVSDVSSASGEKLSKSEITTIFSEYLNGLPLFFEGVSKGVSLAVNESGIVGGIKSIWDSSEPSYVVTANMPILEEAKNNLVVNVKGVGYDNLVALSKSIVSRHKALEKSYAADAFTPDVTQYLSFIKGSLVEYQRSRGGYKGKGTISNFFDTYTNTNLLGYASKKGNESAETVEKHLVAYLLDHVDKIVKPDSIEKVLLSRKLAEEFFIPLIQSIVSGANPAVDPTLITSFLSSSTSAQQVATNTPPAATTNGTNPAPQQVTPQQVAPPGNPQQVTPQQVAPPGNPQQVTPQQVAPQGNPQQVAPQGNTAPKLSVGNNQINGDKVFGTIKLKAGDYEDTKETHGKLGVVRISDVIDKLKGSQGDLLPAEVAQIISLIMKASAPTKKASYDKISSEDLKNIKTRKDLVKFLEGLVASGNVYITIPELKKSTGNLGVPVDSTENGADPSIVEKYTDKLLGYIPSPLMKGLVDKIVGLDKPVTDYDALSIVREVSKADIDIKPKDIVGATSADDVFDAIIDNAPSVSSNTNSDGVGPVSIKREGTSTYVFSDGEHELVVVNDKPLIIDEMSYSDLKSVLGDLVVPDRGGLYYDEYYLEKLSRVEGDLEADYVPNVSLGGPRVTIYGAGKAKIKLDILRQESHKGHISDINSGVDIVISYKIGKSKPVSVYASKSEEETYKDLTLDQVKNSKKLLPSDTVKKFFEENIEGKVTEWSDIEGSLYKSEAAKTASGNPVLPSGESYLSSGYLLNYLKRYFKTGGRRVLTANSDGSVTYTDKKGSKEYSLKSNGIYFSGSKKLFEAYVVDQSAIDDTTEVDGAKIKFDGKGKLINANFLSSDRGGRTVPYSYNDVGGGVIIVARRGGTYTDGDQFIPYDEYHEYSNQEGGRDAFAKKYGLDSSNELNFAVPQNKLNSVKYIAKDLIESGTNTEEGKVTGPSVTNNGPSVTNTGVKHVEVSVDDEDLSFLNDL